MALDTIPKQEGGKLKAVASGTLPSGQPVVVNADGTVSVVAETSTSGTETLGSQVALPTTSGQQAAFLGGTYDSVNQKAIITYRDTNNSGKGTVVVGTVGESSVTWGTPVVFEDANTQWTSCAFDSTNGKVVISYQTKIIVSMVHLLLALYLVTVFHLAHLWCLNQRNPLTSTLHMMHQQVRLLLIGKTMQVMVVE